MIKSDQARPTSKTAWRHYRAMLLGGVTLATVAGLAGRAAAASVDDAQLAEVIVTAQKRPQTLLQVPSAVVAMTGERILENGVTDFIKLSQQAPGVIAYNQLVGGRTVQTFTIRGIGNDDFRPNGSPSAAVHFDGLYLGSAALVGGQMFDIERVEILKGPQGTLYGRNTTAGAINIISRKPGLALDGYANADYGRFNSLRFEGGVGGPLSEQVGLRLSGVYDRTDGYMTNLGAGSRGGATPNPAIPPNGAPSVDHKAAGTAFWGTRALLTWAPAEGTDMTFNLHGFHEDGGQAQSERARAASGFARNQPFTYDANLSPQLKKNSIGASATLEQMLGQDVLLTLIGGVESIKQAYDWNDGVPIRQFDIAYRDEVRQKSVEARIQNTNPSDLEWVVGAIAFADQSNMDSLLDGSDVFRTTFQAKYRQKRLSGAVFGDGSWRFAPRWKLGLGLRYTREESDFIGATVDLNPYGLSIAKSVFPGVPVAFDNQFTDSKVTGKATLSYELGEAAMLYGSLGRGFKGGGFDGSTIFSAPEALPFKSEAVTAYEGGVKFLPRGGPLQIDASVYYYDYKDLQANSLRDAGGGVLTNVRTNVGKADIYGAEINVIARPAQGLEVTVGMSALHAKVSEIVSSSPAEAARRKGNDLPNAPEATFNASARYEIRLSQDVLLVPSISGRYVSKYFAELDNYQSIGDYFLGDARIEAKVRDRWTLAAWMRNITDETYATGLGTVSATTLNIFRGPPRTYGVSLGVKF